MEKDSALKDLNRVSAANLELKMNASALERKQMNLDQHLAGVQKRLDAAENARQEKSTALNQAMWDLQTTQEREKAISAKLSECERRLQLQANQMSQANKEIANLAAEVTAKKNKVSCAQFRFSFLTFLFRWRNFCQLWWFWRKI